MLHFIIMTNLQTILIKIFEKYLNINLVTPFNLFILIFNFSLMKEKAICGLILNIALTKTFSLSTSAYCCVKIVFI